MYLNYNLKKNRNEHDFKLFSILQKYKKKMTKQYPK